MKLKTYWGASTSFREERITTDLVFALKKITEKDALTDKEIAYDKLLSLYQWVFKLKMANDHTMLKIPVLVQSSR